MTSKLLISLVIGVCSSAVLAQPDSAGLSSPQNRRPDNRTVIGGGNELLSAGAEAIRYGRYDDGIRLTLLGLDRPGTTDHMRAAALSNLCAAYAGKNEPDQAIRYCGQSIEINERNWRAWSNRSYAYWLKGMYPEATTDLDVATAINPAARQVSQIRGMLNEAGLQPNIVVEDHQ